MADTNNTNNEEASRARGWLVLKHHMLTHKIDVLLWLTRIATMIFTVGYILPIMGNPYNSYYKALMARMLISLVEFQSRNILRLVAFHEVFLQPFTVLMIFTGKTNLITPILYYRFLGLRYTSRRNPYCRTICHELRLSMEALAYNPKCPSFVKTIIYKAIGLAVSLAPQMEASQ